MDCVAMALKQKLNSLNFFSCILMLLDFIKTMKENIEIKEKELLYIIIVLLLLSILFVFNLKLNCVFIVHSLSTLY